MANSETILGISPGNYTLGIAVIKNGELIDWRLKGFIGKWSKKKERILIEAIEKLIVRYEVNVLAIKITPLSPNSATVSTLTVAIKEIAKKKHIKIQSYSLSEIKKHYADYEKITKKDIALSILKKYFGHTLTRYRHPYYVKMLEAIALADIVYRAKSQSMK